MYEEMFDEIIKVERVMMISKVGIFNWKIETSKGSLYLDINHFGYYYTLNHFAIKGLKKKLKSTLEDVRTIVEKYIVMERR